MPTMWPPAVPSGGWAAAAGTLSSEGWPLPARASRRQGKPPQKKESPPRPPGTTREPPSQGTGHRGRRLNTPDGVRSYLTERLHWQDDCLDSSPSPGSFTGCRPAPHRSSVNLVTAPLSPAQAPSLRSAVTAEHDGGYHPVGWALRTYPGGPLRNQRGPCPPVATTRRARGGTVPLAFRLRVSSPPPCVGGGAPER